MKDFERRSGAAVVSGGTGGIGRAIVRMLADRGADVVFTYGSNREGAEELAADVADATGVRVAVRRAGLGDDDDAGAVVAEAVEGFGGIHTFVHAAGPHIPQRHLSRVTPGEFADNLREEVMGFYAFVHPMLAALRESQGSIVAVTTAATRRYPVRDGMSAGTKASIEAIVRALAVEEGRFGIRVNAVGPGMLTDGMAQRLMASGDLDDAALEAAMRSIPLRRFGRASDIAEAVCFLASDRAGFISGQMLDVDGAYTV